MSVRSRTVGLLLLSHIFMTFAWYAHLRNQGGLCLRGAVYSVFRGQPVQ